MHFTTSQEKHHHRSNNYTIPFLLLVVQMPETPVPHTGEGRVVTSSPPCHNLPPTTHHLPNSLDLVFVTDVLEQGHDKRKEGGKSVVPNIAVPK